MERQSDGTFIKKGPWTPKEDEVLMNFVKKYGPRDWSSIRSMGLLPRTGKSCRLRWVNKLRPNLKTGCKFTAEEERMVIELQAQFGNRWAKIATFLPGRTDNDVKNFWSTRRKRLERILQNPLPKSQKNKGKNPVLHELPTAEVSSCSSIPLEHELSSHKYQPHTPSSSGNAEEFRTVSLPNLMELDLPNMETNLPILYVPPLYMVPSIEFSSHYPLPQLPQPQVDLPLFPEYHELTPASIDSSFLDMVENQGVSMSNGGQNLPSRFSSLGVEPRAQIDKNGENEGPATPDSFFDDFPADMFDCLEPPPSSSEW